MKLLLENWREFINEDIMDRDDALCRSIYTPGFRLFIDTLERSTEAAAEEILPLVRDDMPNVDELYNNFEKESQKKEFLKELFLEYMVEAIVERFQKNNLTIEDFIDNFEKELQRQKQRAPWFEAFKKCLLDGPESHTPSYHMPQGGRANTLTVEPAAEETFAMFENKK